MDIYLPSVKNLSIYLPSIKNYGHLFTFGKKLYRNIKYMPAAIFFVCLDLEKNSSFLDRH